MKTNNNICCVCHKPFTGPGNNPDPIRKTGRCCNKCNTLKVIPARVKQIQAAVANFSNAPKPKKTHDVSNAPIK